MYVTNLTSHPCSTARPCEEKLTSWQMLIELPAAMTLRYFQPRYVFGLALIVFGVFAAIIPPSRSYGGVMALRVLIGLGEAFTTNAYIFITLWYKPKELATRTGLIFQIFSTHMTSSDRLYSGRVWNDTHRRSDQWDHSLWSG